MYRVALGRSQSQTFEFYRQSQSEQPQALSDRIYLRDGVWSRFVNSQELAIIIEFEVGGDDSGIRAAVVCIGEETSARRCRYFERAGDRRQNRIKWINGNPHHLQ